jgi:TonB-linked SusC/RagA family outer membrane protein
LEISCSKCRHDSIFADPERPDSLQREAASTTHNPHWRFRGSAVALLLIVAIAPPAAGQWLISGRVTNSVGQALPGSTVSIPSLGAESVTGADGKYHFALDQRGSGDSILVRVRKVGFQPKSKLVALNHPTIEVDFVLAPQAQSLENVVVTGVADTTKTGNLTISVGRVEASQLADVPPPSIGAALAGKVSGVRVAVTQGEPGAVPAIRIRTSASLGIGENTPLVLVDGVMMRNGLADIDGNDIERIEVLKGAASANTYGSNAANGVIAVFTKRGRNAPEGKTSFLLRSEIGSSSLERYPLLSRSHPYVLNPDGSFALVNGSRVVKSDHYVDAPYPEGTWRDQLKANLERGSYARSYGQLSFRRGDLNFAASFARDHDRGLTSILHGFDRQSASLVLDQGLSSRAEMSIDLRYSVSHTDQATEAFGGFPLFGIMFSEPDVDLVYPNGPGTLKYSPDFPEGSPQRGNVLYGLANFNHNDRRERIIGSFSARYRASDWLSFAARYGTDRFNGRVTDFTDRGVLRRADDGPSQPGAGSISLGSTANNAYMGELNAIAKWSLGAVRQATQLSYQYEDERKLAFFTGFGRLLVGSVPDLQAADPASLGGGAFSSIQQMRAMNYFVTQDLNFRDRYLAQMLLRRDGSSLFGSGRRWHNFSGVSGAWRVTRDFHIPGIDELKLRAARGSAGLRPGFEYQYEAFDLRSGTISKGNVGNKLLEPAVQTESEFGVNARAGRVEVEYVKSDRHTTGAFLQVPLSPAQSGGFVTQWRNGARIGGRTFELALSAAVIERPGLNYSASLTAERSRQRIDELGRPPFRVGIVSNDVFYYRTGEVMGVLYGTRWARTVDELKDNPENASLDATNYTVNSDGYVVLAACRGQPCERPIAYVDPDGNSNVKIGDVNPDYTFGFANTIQARGLRLYMLFDGVHGGNIYNSTKQFLAVNLRSRVVDQERASQADKKAFDYYEIGVYNNASANSFYVEDGSYVKLRECSLSWTPGARLLRRLHLDEERSFRFALIGRNLKTWTRYSGMDPETAEGGDFNLREDRNNHPALRQLTAQIELKF